MASKRLVFYPEITYLYNSNTETSENKLHFAEQWRLVNVTKFEQKKLEKLAAEERERLVKNLYWEILIYEVRKLNSFHLVSCFI